MKVLSAKNCVTYNTVFNLTTLLSRFVPFASLSQAQNAPIAARPELQVKQMLCRRLAPPRKEIKNDVCF
jgi:hypothetical protein